MNCINLPLEECLLFLSVPLCSSFLTTPANDTWVVLVTTEGEWFRLDGDCMDDKLVSPVAADCLLFAVVLKSLQLVWENCRNK